MSNRILNFARPSMSGFTYIELLVTLAIGALLVAGLNGVMGQALQSRDAAAETNRLTREASSALQRMTRAVSRTRLLLLPQNDKASTNWPENLREETVPPSAPVGDSSFASAVLAVTLPADIDLDGDGIADADNDGDGLLDEDLPADAHNDGAAGIFGIDDGGDGTVDEGPAADDDESLSDADEDPIDGIEDDDDANLDEDPAADNNGDGCPGICGVDDDNDGNIDTGNAANDDEQGGDDEDWYDPLVFFLDNGVLKQRSPVPWDENGVDGITGRDVIVSDIATDVTRFSVERIALGDDRRQLVRLQLELTSPLTGETVSLQTRVRVGGAL